MVAPSELEQRLEDQISFEIFTIGNVRHIGRGWNSCWAGAIRCIWLGPQETRKDERKRQDEHKSGMMADRAADRPSARSVRATVALSELEQR
mmetsp:Transcript_53232/g.113753  ORF Transcript_53232/g.113753 Transcript_53232/m.113753 type:complete len:92 (-) Transcript_53232:808-1083(-)